MELDPNPAVILVIEDDPSIRTLLRDVFTEEGYEVLLAESGEKALVTLTTVRPDLITLDLDLPGINGAAVLRQLREQEETESLLVVVVPAKEAISTEVKAQEETESLLVVVVSAKEAISTEVKAQVQAIVRKPFDVDDLLAVVRRLLLPQGKLSPTATSTATPPLG